MKKLTFIAAAFAALALSTPAQAFDAPASVKAAWKATILEETKGMSLESFCTAKGTFSFAVEGTAPDSVERGIDYGMVEAYYVKARNWSNDQKSQCVKLEMAAYFAARDAAEEE